MDYRTIYTEVYVKNGDIRMDKINTWKSIVKELEVKLKEIDKKADMSHMERVSYKIAVHENYDFILSGNYPMKHAPFTDYQALTAEEEWEFVEEEICYNEYMKEHKKEIEKLKHILVVLTMESFGWDKEFNAESCNCMWKNEKTF